MSFRFTFSSDMNWSRKLWIEIGACMQWPSIYCVLWSYNIDVNSARSSSFNGKLLLYLPSSYQFNIPVIFNCLFAYNVAMFYYKISKHAVNVFLHIRKHLTRKTISTYSKHTIMCFFFFMKLKPKQFHFFCVFLLQPKSEYSRNPNGKNWISYSDCI